VTKKKLKVVVVGVGHTGNGIIDELVDKYKIDKDSVEYIYMDDASKMEESKADVKIKLDYYQPSGFDGKEELWISKWQREKDSYKDNYENLIEFIEYAITKTTVQNSIKSFKKYSKN